MQASPPPPQAIQYPLETDIVAIFKMMKQALGSAIYCYCHSYWVVLELESCFFPSRRFFLSGLLIEPLIISQRMFICVFELESLLSSLSFRNCLFLPPFEVSSFQRCFDWSWPVCIYLQSCHQESYCPNLWLLGHWSLPKRLRFLVLLMPCGPFASSVVRNELKRISVGSWQKDALEGVSLENIRTKGGLSNR